MATTKTVLSDGDVIFREGDLCEHACEVLSGLVDLLKLKDGKYARRGTLKSGTIFGETDTPYPVTLRAKGRVVIRTTEMPPNVDLKQQQSTGTTAAPKSKEGMVSALLRHLGASTERLQSQETANQPNTATPVKPYSNPGFIRRLIDELSSGVDRINVRVALLAGDTTKEHTRHVISALGNNQFIQTKAFKKPVSIDPSGDIRLQHERIATAARRWLALQGADILIWGYIPPSGQAIHLHFVTLAHWDQQAPGAFDLETTLALPVSFSHEFADLLRIVTLAAALPRSSTRKHVRQQALGETLNLAASALDLLPSTLTKLEQASIHLCYANALAAASRPGYVPELLSEAHKQYLKVLSVISKNDAPYDWASAQKHLGSILHIDGERKSDPSMLENAAQALNEANTVFTFERQPKAWAIVQNRLGLISYRQGFNDGDTKQLRRALKYFTAALKAYSKESTPLRWAEIMSNFAQAAQVLGGYLKSMEALATAANACRAVLDVRSRKKTPLAWAATQNNLGSALFMLGKQTQNPERLQASINAFEQALIVYREAGSEQLARVTEKNMKRAEGILDLYQPRNLPALDWEDEEEGEEISRNEIFKLPEPGEDLIHKDKRRQSSESLTHNKAGVEPEWFSEAV